MNTNDILKRTELSRGISGEKDNINLFDPVLSCIYPQIEQKSLQVSMESNKESLERRLQLRRTLPELVSQGIYPKLNTPLVFAEQCRHLEQAKARDLLQKKLKHRPDRQCLVQHHILEDTHPLVDRSLQDKQRLLKKSKLQDNLNDLLSHRPGPLDLLSKNILMLDDESLSPPDDTNDRVTDSEEHIFSDSSNNFNALFSGSFDAASFDSSSVDNVSSINQSADEHSKHPSSSSFEFVNVDEGEQLMYPYLSSPEDIYAHHSSDKIPPVAAPSEIISAATNDLQRFVSRHDIPPAPDITPLLLATARQHYNLKNELSDATTSLTLSASLPLASLPDNLPIVTPASVASTSSAYRQQKSQKKMRTKSVTKPKQIKFHEYKGPPSVVKGSQQTSSKNKPTQPHYEMLKLQQEQLMKWQVAPKTDCDRQVMSRIAPKPEIAIDPMNNKEYNNSFILSRQARMLDMINFGSSDIQKPEKSKQVIHMTSSVPTIPCTNIVAIKSSEPGRTLTFNDWPQVRLDEMKVSELRAECRRLNISCSGSKPQLLERLQFHRNNLFSLNSTIELCPSSIKNEFSGNVGRSSVAASVPILPMEVEMNAASLLPAQNPVYILDSGDAFGKTAPQGPFLPAVQNSPPSYESSLSESKSQLQFNACVNDIKKIEGDKLCLSTEDRMKISEEKVAILEHDLKQAKHEIKMRNQLIQLMMLSASKSGNARVPAAVNGITNQTAQSQQREGLEKLNALANGVSAENLPYLNQQLYLDTSTGKMCIRPENSGRQMTGHAFPNLNKQILSSPQLQQIMLQNLMNGRVVCSEVRTRPLNDDGSFAAMKQTFASSGELHGRDDFNCLSQGVSHPIIGPHNDVPNSFLPGSNSYQVLEQAKNVKDANQKASQNSSGTSVEHLLKLWSMQNQHKKEATNQHLQTPYAPTIEDVLDVLSTKSEFSSCDPIHQPDEMDFFSAIPDNPSQGMDVYDVSFPLVMNSSEVQQQCFANGSSIASRDSKMRTPQPESELMDIFTGDDIDVGNSIFSSLDQNSLNHHTLFSHANSVYESGNNFANNQQQPNMKNGCFDVLSDFDLGSFPLLSASNCTPFEKAFAVNAMPKS